MTVRIVDKNGDRGCKMTVQNVEMASIEKTRKSAFVAWM